MFSLPQRQTLCMHSRLLTLAMNAMILFTEVIYLLTPKWLVFNLYLCQKLRTFIV